MTANKQSANWQSADWLGRSTEQRMRITPEMVRRFADLSGDHSPNHTSDAAAQAQGFERLVVHGWLLGSLVSGVLGMHFPAVPGVEHELQLSFRNPCYPGDEVLISVEVSEFFESVQTLVLKVKITRTDGTTLAVGRIQFGLK
jgi:acyl dehydratase